MVNGNAATTSMDTNLKINFFFSSEFSQNISLNCCVIWIRHSLASLRIQRAEDDGVDGVVSPEEQPAGGDTGCHSAACTQWSSVFLWHASQTFTSSGCQWAWCPAPTLWSGPRWTAGAGPRRWSAWWPSEPPGDPSETPAPQSPGTTRYTLHRGHKHTNSETD